MAKRHHGSHHRPDSHQGHERGGDGYIAENRDKHSEGYYAGEAERRHQEMRDAGMIMEDRSAIANLPQNVMIKAYPKTGPYMPEVLDDTLRGVDKQMDYDDSQRRMHFFPKKV